MTKTKSVSESNDIFYRIMHLKTMGSDRSSKYFDLNKAKTSKTSALKKVVEKSSDIWRGYAHERILSDGT